MVGPLLVVKATAPGLTVVVFIAAHSSPVRDNPTDISFPLELSQEPSPRHVSCREANGVWPSHGGHVHVETALPHAVRAPTLQGLADTGPVLYHDHDHAASRRVPSLSANGNS